MRHLQVFPLLAGLLMACAPLNPSPTQAGRERAVAEVGARVMPFDLNRSTHTFTDAEWGGEQRVISDDGDVAQIALIRAHLAAEARRFAEGDFSSPENIHGHDMPGLAVLRQHSEALSVGYADTAQGGVISYRARDPAIIEALHAWFAAQRTDHGAHAAH